MCVEASTKNGHANSSCGCGGHGHRPAPPDPRAILAMKFGEAAEVQQCRCGGGGRCPRQYLALAGFALAGFWVLHLAVNLLGLWPAAFQAVVSRGHALGLALPVLEAGLIFIPLAVHVGLGLRTLAREKLTYGVPKHHQGSALRQWLQRVSAVVLLGFLGFHLLTMQRGLGGRFDAHHAFSSASGAIWQFWRELPAGHPGNVLVAQLYLIGLVAAAYHVGNGIATGAGVLGLTRTPAAERRLWVICRVAAPVLLLAGVVAWGAFAVR